MLISHYAALSGQTKTVTGMVGTVDQECDLTTVARSVTGSICDRLEHGMTNYVPMTTRCQAES